MKILRLFVVLVLQVITWQVLIVLVSSNQEAYELTSLVQLLDEHPLLFYAYIVTGVVICNFVLRRIYLVPDRCNDTDVVEANASLKPGVDR